MLKIKTRFHDAKINDKFNALLIIAFMFGIILSGLTLSNILYQRAQYEVAIQAELLMETMNSLRIYTQDEVNPWLKPKLDDVSEFIPEAIPTFSVKQVSRHLSQSPAYKNFSYKDATLNPTNLEDQADEFETKLVEEFKSHPERLEITGFRSYPNGDKFYTARPFVVKEQRCLECHSIPERAPQSLINTYGKNGFGWNLGDIVAAQMVYVPSEDVFNNARKAIFKMMTVVFVVFIAVILLMNYLLKKVVVARIRNIANTANAISTGDMTSQFKESSKDEIGLLAVAFERMKSSLLIAMDLLK
ncbi:MAG: DUF3365 domain-containing protein [Cyanobacteria bacterium J06621_15]